MLNRSVRLFAFIATTLFCALAPSAAHAQCDNPKSNAQRAQCVGDELRGSDRTINRVYGDLMKSLSPDDRNTRLFDPPSPGQPRPLKRQGSKLSQRLPTQPAPGGAV